MNNSILPERRLITIRIIWFAMLLGELMFLAVIAFGVLPRQSPPQYPQPVLSLAIGIMLVTVVPVGFAIRLLMLRDGGNGVSFQRFMTANIILWAACEGVAMAGIVVALVNGALWPTVGFSAVAMLVQLVTFPKSRGFAFEI